MVHELSDFEKEKWKKYSCEARHRLGWAAVAMVVTPVLSNTTISIITTTTIIIIATITIIILIAITKIIMTRSQNTSHLSA